jgi:N-acyl-D-aspartate/D-glutamate deacylase
MIYDLVIKNGTVVSFRPGKPLKEQNIGILNGVIKKRIE